MSELLIILCPPRSFSSVVSTMIGQHPEMYCFPELHLFVGNMMKAVMEHEARRGKPHGPPGLLRTLAQLHDGVQTAVTVAEARMWLHKRMDWSTKQLYDYLLEKLDEQVAPKIVVEKSPPTVIRPQFLDRAYAFFPKAYYLHLTRHPITTSGSLKEFRENRAKRFAPIKEQPLNSFIFWTKVHKNIINFTNTLPVGQSMRIKGEDLLSEPDVYLPQIAQWLGLRTDKEAIEAMKHPENSPYAFIGPVGATGGNDGKFMRNPKLRPGKVKEPSLADSLAKGEFEGILDQAETEELLELARQMGYQ